jgi:hypothetical protein
VDSCTSTSTTFSSPTSLCTSCASTKCCSTASSCSHSSMNTECIDVVPSPVCSLACQRLLLLRKNSHVDVPVVSI